jgi:hypothetical protein
MIMRCIGLLMLSLCLTGCISLSRSDKDDLRTIKEAGLGTTDESVKSVPLAGALNVLPGFGNFYLAFGTEESEMWLVGFMNLLFWPISIVWGIPEAVIDAGNINKRETIYHYMKTEEGRRILQEALDKQRSMPAIR